MWAEEAWGKDYIYWWLKDSATDVTSNNHQQCSTTTRFARQWNGDASACGPSGADGQTQAWMMMGKRSGEGLCYLFCFCWEGSVVLRFSHSHNIYSYILATLLLTMLSAQAQWAQLGQSKWQTTVGHHGGLVCCGFRLLIGPPPFRPALPCVFAMMWNSSNTSLGLGTRAHNCHIPHI